jgi:hypothetical protein
MFASTTTSGYSDPLKAQSIKALEQRMKDMQAQQAAQQPDAAMMATIPGGIGHVLGVAADGFREMKAASALEANKAELSGIMAQIDPEKGPTPQQGAAIARLAPDIFKDYMAQQQSRWTTNTEQGGLNRRNTETIAGQAATNAATNAAHIQTNELTNKTSAGNVEAQVKSAQQIAQERIAADKAAAAEKARVDEQSKRDEEYRIGQRPSSDIAKIENDVTNGRMTRQQADEAIAKLTAKTPSEEKLIIGERDKAIEYQSTLKELDKAHELISSPKGIHSGNAVTTPLKTAVGSVIPQSIGGPDDETQANTKQFNLIMKSQGLQNLLAMKGASSDKDVTLNLEIANDPSQPLERRKQALDIARNKLYTHVKANEEDIARISGKYPTLQTAPGSSGGTPAAPAATDKNAAARAWLADPANKSNPDYDAVRKKVEGK